MIADAVLWHGAGLSHARTFVADPADRDLLGRALIFRLVAEQLSDDARRDGVLQPYRRLLAALA